MDSVAALSSMQTARIGNEISFAVAKKAMDSAKQQGQAAVSLLQKAAEVGKAVSNPNGSIDLVA